MNDQRMPSSKSDFYTHCVWKALPSNKIATWFATQRKKYDGNAVLHEIQIYSRSTDEVSFCSLWKEAVIRVTVL